MIIKQGTNDANIITGALTSTIGVVISSITMIGVRAIVTLVLITLILVPLTRVVIDITRIWVVVVIIRVVWGSVPIISPSSTISPTSLMLGILISISLMGLGIMTSASLIGLALILIVRVFDFKVHI